MNALSLYSKYIWVNVIFWNTHKYLYTVLVISMKEKYRWKMIIKLIWAYTL